MSRWTKSIEVAKPPEDVWSTLVDYPNLPKWTAKVSKVDLDPEGPAVVGTKVTITRGRITFIQTIEEMRAPEFVRAGVVNGPVTGSSTFSVKKAGTGSHVQHTLELDLKGVGKLFAPFIGGGVRKELVMLKRQVEGKPNEPPKAPDDAPGHAFTGRRARPIH